jgi:glycosyl transferase family 41/tetratricopeptide repeat protein
MPLNMFSLFRKKSAPAQALEGSSAEDYYKRANAMNKLEQWHEALAAYDQAIALRPDYAIALCNRGTVLEKLDRPDEALQSYDRSIEISPGDALAWFNRGSVLRTLQRPEQALTSYERAVAIQGNFAEAHYNLGLQRLALKRLDAAIQSFDKALELTPDIAFLQGLTRHTKMWVSQWGGFEQDLGKIIDGLRAHRPVCAPMVLSALLDSLPLQHLTAQIWMRTQCPAREILPPIIPRPRGEKIRIGYFSSDFREHAVSILTAGLFAQHDRSRFEITAFAFGPHSEDAMRARLRQSFDQFIDVRDRSDLEVAQLARDLGIDIAVDLGGYTENSRTGIFALRAAPAQLSYIGYLGTMGAPYMDYLIADATLIPENSRAHYSEKIAYLPCFQVNDAKRQIADRIFTREELGLPSTGFVFACFNANYKILPETFDQWMRILARVAGSVLFLYVDNTSAEANLRMEATLRGVAQTRLVFARRVTTPEYLSRYRTMDLFLDTAPYNAGTTASDALWMGLPVLTCQGESFPARMAASLLQAIGLPELITTSSADYERRAVQLATEADALLRIRQRLAENRLSSALFDTPRFARNLEAAYEKIYERCQLRLPPDHIFPADLPIV